MSWFKRSKSVVSKEITEQTERLERARLRRKIAMAKLIRQLDQYVDRDNGEALQYQGRDPTVVLRRRVNGY